LGQTDVHRTDLLIGWLVPLLVMCMLVCLLLTHSLALPFYCLQSLALFFSPLARSLPSLFPLFPPLTQSFVQGGWFVVRIRHYISGFYVLAFQDFSRCCCKIKGLYAASS